METPRITEQHLQEILKHLQSRRQVSPMVLNASVLEDVIQELLALREIGATAYRWRNAVKGYNAFPTPDKDGEIGIIEEQLEDAIDNHIVWFEDGGSATCHLNDADTYQMAGAQPSEYAQNLNSQSLFNDVPGRPNHPRLEWREGVDSMRRIVITADSRATGFIHRIHIWLDREGLAGEYYDQYVLNCIDGYPTDGTPAGIFDTLKEAKDFCQDQDDKIACERSQQPAVNSGEEIGDGIELRTLICHGCQRPIDVCECGAKGDPA